MVQSQGNFGPLRCEYESGFPQNLKGVIASASIFGLLLQALPCAGFDRAWQVTSSSLSFSPLRKREYIQARRESWLV